MVNMFFFASLPTGFGRSLVKQCSVSWLAMGWQCTASVAPRNNSKLLKLDLELLDVIEGLSNLLQSFSSSFQNVVLS